MVLDSPVLDSAVLDSAVGWDEETLSVEASVAVEGGRVVAVQIAEHNYGEYWKVTTSTDLGSSSSVISTTEDEESFVWHLVHRALRGDQAAWADLARLGTHPSFACPAAAPR